MIIYLQEQKCVLDGWKKSHVLFAILNRKENVEETVIEKWK